MDGLISRLYEKGIEAETGYRGSVFYPEAFININYQLRHAMFCEIENVEITDEMIKNVKN